MSPMVSFFLFFSLLTLLSIARAQDGAPHGIVYENPIAFTPSAYDFFHPSTQRSCETSNCSPLPVAAQVVEATPGHESRELESQKGSRVGAAAIAGIAFGLVFAVLLGMGVYYVVITRRANVSRTNSVQPDA
ncbi:uncharacterized protein LOC132164424 [Corylus avellana]|uniref:uncharacterized protein LOC132162993 n=1 Tax=Corylus avellana TaxID=13451 RepID=UPI001E2111FC|nr:uncharacterized protein LOC132162993 [Corylus avellana]XP_059430918.1 uncharacterized protein LOC132164424 [Corylus avellana]